MQALAELLKVTHRGYFIPPRPEKNPVEGQRASSDFVELRRHALEKYLVQLASHPAIVQSDVGILHTELPDFVHYLMALSGAQLCALAQALLLACYCPSLLLACYCKSLYAQGWLCLEPLWRKPKGANAKHNGSLRYYEHASDM